MNRPISPGEVIGGKYAILRRVGRGGMGVVFEARHVVIGRRVGIKFLRSDVTWDERRLTRLEREARACGALHHENIAAVLDFAKDEQGRPYIVMEFVEGTSLRELLEANGPLEPQRAVDLVSQAARGLSAAHEAGVLHRDLKPENLMLTRRADGSDWIKLLDFGVARLVEDQDANTLTIEGQTPGTPHYLSPEVARGEQPASVVSDCYALGVVLFELLTGRRPHPSGNHHTVLHHIAERPAARVEELRPELPAPLVRAVNRMLSRDASERPRTALEIVRILHSAQATSADAAPETVTALDAGSGKEGSGPSFAAGSVSGSVPTITPVGGHLPPPERRSPRALMLGALLFLLGAVALLSWLGQSADGSATNQSAASPPLAPPKPASAPTAENPPPREPASAEPAESDAPSIAASAGRAAGTPPKPPREQPKRRPDADAKPPRPSAEPLTPKPPAPSTAPGFDRNNPFRN